MFKQLFVLFFVAVMVGNSMQFGIPVSGANPGLGGIGNAVPGGLGGVGNAVPGALGGVGNAVPGGLGGIGNVPGGLGGAPAAPGGTAVPQTGAAAPGAAGNPINGLGFGGK